MTTELLAEAEALKIEKPFSKPGLLRELDIINKMFKNNYDRVKELEARVKMLEDTLNEVRGGE